MADTAATRQAVCGTAPDPPQTESFSRAKLSFCQAQDRSSLIAVLDTSIHLPCGGLMICLTVVASAQGCIHESVARYVAACSHFFKKRVKCIFLSRKIITSSLVYDQRSMNNCGSVCIHEFDDRLGKNAVSSVCLPGRILQV